MATFRKRAAGRWRVEIKLAGVRESATRATKAEAAAWARQREADILAHRQGRIVARSVRQALSRYASEVSPTHRGARWEQLRLAKLSRSLPFIDRPLAEIRTADVAEWRDAAIAGTLTDRAEDGEASPRPALAPASVRREMVLLRSVFEQARKEWGWLRDNPMAGIRWPSAGRPRQRRLPGHDLERLLLALDYSVGAAPTRPPHWVAVAVLLAVETAMRAGELCGLTWPAVDLAARVATLPRTKNGDAREVPLSSAAVALLDGLPRDGPRVLQVSAKSLDVLFRRARDRAGILDLHFHDTRAEALTRLAAKVDVLTLARIAGHRDLKSLSVYYRESAADIARRIG